MAMAARRERGLLDPDAAPGESPFDHQIYCLASDGDIEEGITSEASSLAGTQRLGNLTADLRPQPHLDRGRHQHRPHRGHRAALRGVRLARRRASTGPTASTAYDENVAGAATTRWRRPARSPTGRASSACARSSAGPPRTQQGTGKAHGSRARRRRGRGDQGGPRLRPGADLRGRPTRSSATPASCSSAAQPAQAEWQTALRRPGPRPTPRARRSTTGWSPTS